MDQTNYSLYPGLGMGPVHVLSSCIACQPTFSTFSSQRDLRIHFRTRLGNRFRSFSPWWAWDHTSQPKSPSTGAFRVSQSKDQNCPVIPGQTVMRSLHLYIDQEDLNAKRVPKWHLQLFLLARAKQCSSVWLLVCALISILDHNACFPSRPPW